MVNNTSSDKSGRGWAALLVRVGALVLAAIGCISFAAGRLSMEQLRALVVPVLSSREVGLFTPNLYSHILLGLLGLAVACILLAIGLFCAAAAIGGILSSFWSDSKKLCRDAATRLRALWVYDSLRVAELGALTLWAAVLRCFFLSEPMRYDEAYTYLRYASKPIYIGAVYYTANNHLFNTVLMHLSSVLIGGSPWALRLPTVVAGVLIVPLSFEAMRLCRGNSVGLLTAALVASSFPLIEYATNARGYTLGTLFLLLTIVLAKLGERSPVAFILAGFAAAFALYSVPTMVYGVSGIFLWVAFSTRSVRLLARLVVPAVTLAALLYSPVLASVGVSKIVGNQWVEPMSYRQLWAETPFAIGSLWQYWNMRVPVVVAVLFAAAALVSIVHGVWHRSPPILLWAIIGSAVLLLMQRVDPPRRVWLFLAPLYLGAVAEGLDLILSRLPSTTTSVVALALSAWMGVEVLRDGSLYRPGGEEHIFHNAEEYGFPNAAAFVREFGKHLAHGDTVVSSGPYDIPIEYEMRRQDIPYKSSPSGDCLIVTIPGTTPGVGAVPFKMIRKVASYQYADIYLASKRDLPRTNFPD